MFLCLKTKNHFLWAFKEQGALFKSQQKNLPNNGSIIFSHCSLISPLCGYRVRGKQSKVGIKTTPLPHHHSAVNNNSPKIGYVYIYVLSLYLSLSLSTTLLFNWPSMFSAAAFFDNASLRLKEAFSYEYHCNSWLNFSLKFRSRLLLGRTSRFESPVLYLHSRDKMACLWVRFNWVKITPA